MMLPLLLFLSCNTDSAAPALNKKNQAEQSVPSTSTSTARPANALTVSSLSNRQLRYPERSIKYPFVIPLTQKHQQAAQILKNLVKWHGLAGDNPWALSHAILALGRGTKMSNGDDAVDVLFKHAKVRNIENVPFPYFPRENSEGEATVRVEPHKDLIFKVLAEVQVPMDKVVNVMGADFPISDLYKGAILATYLNPYTNESSFTSPNDMPWSVQAIATVLQPDEQWIAENEQVMGANDLSRFLVAVLGQESTALKKAMNSGAEFQKDGTGVFKYTCGGAHLLQGAAYAMARGFGNDKTHQEILTNIDLLYYRFPRELKIYDDIMQQRPEYKIKLLVQRLKFVGHFLETAQKLSLLGYYIPNESQQRMLQGALDQLVLVVEALAQEGILQTMYNIKINDEQLYLDLIGDSAHALYAIQLISGGRRILF